MAGTGSDGPGRGIQGGMAGLRRDDQVEEETAGMLGSVFSFSRELKPFTDACPGPGLANHVVHRAVNQRVDGIRSGLSVRSAARAPDTLGSPPTVERRRRGRAPYTVFIREWASLLNCRPAYLTEDALRHGYSLSLALRYVRFLHGMGLGSRGFKPNQIAWRLRFSDVPGWTRFAVRLVGQPAGALPPEPLSHWVKHAVEEVFSAASRQ